MPNVCYELPASLLGMKGSQLFENQLIDAVRGNQMKVINEFLFNLVDLSNIHDLDGRTVLHLATLNNNSFAFHEILLRQKKYLQQIQELDEQKTKEQISYWINKQDNQGNSVALLAAYTGNMEILKKLAADGADFQVQNKKSQSLMHLATQGNQVLMLVYLREQLLFLPSYPDLDLTTPLHQACFYGWYNITAILLSWGVDVNIQDLQGSSPLHICALKNQNKIAKKLLYRQGDKTLLNNQNQTPAMLAQQFGNKDVFMTLTTQSAKCQQTCVKLAFKPRNRTKSFFYAFLLIFGFTFITTTFINIPEVKYTWALFFYFVSAASTLTIFFIACLSDPGYTPNMNGRTKLYSLLQSNDFEDVCVDCTIAKPFRSKHCEFCQRCVMVYDHHCPWIDNCIGTNNHFLFILFVANLTVFIVISLWLNCDEVYQLALMNINQDKQFQIIMRTIVIFVGITFVVPLIYLIYVQTNNLLLDQTTFERLIIGKVQRGETLQRRKTLSRLSLKEYANQISDKSIKNCGIVCFKNKNIKRYRVEQDLNDSRQ